MTGRHPRPVLAVRGLQVSFPSEAGRVNAVRGMSFELHPGRTLGIVGESGSGKSVTALAIMGLLPETAKVTGSVMFGDRQLLGLGDEEMSTVRGRGIGMVFQDPISSLTPIFTVGRQIVEALQIHQDMDRDVAGKRAVDLLDLVGIPHPRTRVKSFPHEFSGGMRQRVVIAMAIANNPRLIIADEPTTALDVTVQAQILDVLKVAAAETGAAVLLITHDLGVIAGAADDVMVMYAGRPAETAPVYELFADPRMPYTIGLLGAVPRVNAGMNPLVPIPGNPPLLIDLQPGCPFAPRCPVAVGECTATEPKLAAASMRREPRHAVACIRSGQIRDRRLGGRPIFPLPALRPAPLAGIPRGRRPAILEVANLNKTFPLTAGALLKHRVGSVYAVNDVTFDIREGEALGLVGESGSGKSSTLMEVMGLRAPEHGRVTVAGVDVATVRGRGRERELRRRIQMVFQDPIGALDPRMTIFNILAEPLRAMGARADDVIADRVDELMDLVGLDPAHSDRFPVAFSGGQRQRIGIARALATYPSVVVLDEPVAALDVSIQAGVINLLNELRAKLGLSYLFVAHDLSVVRHVVDRVAVMYLGRIVEIGGVDDVFDDPQHPYTRALLAAVPVPDPTVEAARHRILLPGDQPSATESEPGCRFRPRCSLHRQLSDLQQARCVGEAPTLTGQGHVDHRNACHFR